VTSTKRVAVLALLILNGLLLPLSLLPLTLLFEAVNPMEEDRIAEFTVENRTGETIYLTPIGDDSHQSRPLPLCNSHMHSIPDSEYARIPIHSGQAITLHYDRYEAIVSWLVVETNDGTLRQRSVYPHSRSEGGSDHWVIERVSELDPVEASVHAAYNEARTKQNPFPLTLTACTLPSLLFLPLLWWHRKLTPPCVMPPCVSKARPACTDLQSLPVQQWSHHLPFGSTSSVRSGRV